MRKESKNYSLWQRFGAMVLAAVLVLGMIPATGVAAAGSIGTVHKTEDPETLTRPQAIYGDNTLNAGKVTVGKSVSKDAITVDGKNIGLIDDNNFLVTISQTAQVMGLSSQTHIPVDVVFVIDTSGSMEDNDRAESLVTAANSAIKTLMETNDQNRVAVVAFSSAAQYWNNQWSDWGGGTAGGGAANVLSSLAHYTGDAATNHLQWVNAQGEASGSEQVYIAGRDQATITVTERQWLNGRWQNVQVQKNVNAFRHGKSGGTNIQAGVTLGAEILTAVQNTTWTNPETNETVTRIPFLIVISDGQPTFVSDSETWYDFSGNGQKGPGSGAYEGNGFISALTAAYYKGKITEHYYGSKASADNHCFVYTMGVELEALDDSNGQSVVGDEQSLSQITLDPVTYASGSYAENNAQSYYRYGNTWNEDRASNRSTANSFMTYWSNYVAGNEFSVRVNSNETFKFTSASIQASRQYVNGIGYTGGLLYNDDYFAVDDVEQLGEIFTALIATIQEKAITVPTKVSTGDHDFDGYITFADPLGEYMEVKDMKGILANGTFYRGATAAQYMTSGTNAEFNAALEKVLVTRLTMTGSTATGVNLLQGAKASPYQAYYNGPEDYDNSIIWWGKGYRIDGEEDPGMQVISSAYNDSIEYITADSTVIPEGATHVCRSYFFVAPGQGQSLEYLYFVVRVQRSLKAPYQQTVVISAPASLLSVEKVMINETFDNDGDPVYTATVTEADPLRVVYEVGLWDTINEETVSTIVSETYRNEAVNGEGQVNYDAANDTYWFFTNDWDRQEDQDHHHRAMAKATFDAAADNAFYTYQEDTLLVDANGNPVTGDPRGTQVYYVRTYYDWSGASLENGTYEAVKKTQLIEVDIPADAEMVQKDGKWYIPKGAYTAATLIVNGDDTVKSDNATNTSEIVAHPHRTGDAGNSHYTVLLGNNGSISLKSNVPAPTKTVSNITKNIVNADGQSVMVGEELEYTIHAKNYGTETGTITITDTVPAGTVFVSADNGVTPDGAGKLTWVLENVAPGAEVTVSFRVKVTEAALDNAVVPSTIQNTATVRLNNGPDYDTNTTHNPPQGKKVVVQGKPDGSSVQVGDILQYFIEFHNDTGAVAEEITIVDTLPAGTTFVTADHNGVYDAASHTVTWTFANVAAGVGGVVSCSVQVDASAQTPIENGAEIDIGNHSHITNKTNTPVELGSLELKKTVVIPQGLTPAEDTFVLTLTDPTGKLNGTYSGVTFVNGVATVEIRHGETVTIEGLAAGTTILVTESVPAGFKATFTGNGQAVIPANGTASVEVTNTYAVSDLEVTLQGDKTLTGGSPDNERFGFTVVPCDAHGNPTGAAVSTGEVTLTSGTKTFSFGRLTFNAPGVYHYLVTEVNGGQTGVTYTETQYLVTIEVADDGQGKLVQVGQTQIQSRQGNSGAFTDYQGTMLFVNEYRPLSTSVTFTGTKTLTGRDLKAGEFSFVVTENGAVVSTGSNNADGTVSFRPITYTEAGTHTYVITEQAGNLPGVTYSTASYTVTVEVVDVDGQLVATVTGADGIAFENTFDPKEVTVTLEAEKVLTGAVLTEGQFSFVVKDENGNQVASGSNDATGKIIFSKIEYFLEDLEGARSKTFYYTITELVPDSGVDPSLFYDDLQIEVSVTLSYDPAIGVLSVGQPVYSADTTFNNIDNPDTVTVTPEGVKIIQGNMPAGAKFSFSVIDAATNTPVVAGVSGANGVITFSGITYDYDNLGGADSKTFRYWITEDRGGSTHAGIAYDGTKYLMVVTLSKTGTNELSVQAEYFALDPNVLPEQATESDYNVPVNQASFTNKYQVTTGTTVTMKVTKDLVNLELTAGKFEFGLYHNGTLVATATNAADGTVTFTRVYPAGILAAYDTDGDGIATIEYVIRELNNNIPGVDYATNEVRVTVQIEDDGQGGMKDPVVTYLDPTVFTNTYTPDPIQVNLEADKDLTGRDLESGEFAFVVIDESGSEVAWGTNDANGNVVFSNLVYGFGDAGKTFTYIVKEVKPDLGADPNLYYDPSEFTVEVTVSYSETTGLLSYDIDYPADMEFNNIQNPATVAVTPEGTKSTTGNVPGDTKFSYSVIDAQTGAPVGAGTSGIDGDISFSTLIYDAADVGSTYYYWIVEDNGGSTHAGITYDGAKYLMVVTVSRNATGALVADVDYYIVVEGGDYREDDHRTAATVAFSNVYQVTEPATVTITAGKDLTGRDLRAGEFSFNLYHLHGGNKTLIATTSNGYDGNAAAVVFARAYAPSILTEHGDGKTATVYYVIEEQNNGLGGVDYSQALPIYVKVVITDLENGTMDTQVTYYTDDAFTQEITGTPTFVNDYSTENEGYTPVVDKILDGRDMADDEFSFVVTDLQGNPVSYGLSKKAASGEAGVIVFSEITYTYEQYITATERNGDGDAIFRYIISEIPGNLVNVSYTNVRIYLQVTVEDLGNGKLKATGQYFSDDAFTQAITGTPVFRNGYTAQGTTVVLEASKTLTGREKVEGEFSFQVKDAAGNVVATGSNMGGTVVFSGIGITAGMMDGQLTRDFVFTLEELNTNQGAVQFDTNLYYAKVTVTNNLATGKLEVTGVTYYSDAACQNALPGAAEFVNAYAPTPAEVVIPIHKELINHTLEQGMFEFVLMMDGQHVGDVINDGNGNASFNLHYRVEMLDGVTPDANNVRSKTFVYTVTEVAGTADRDDDNGTYTYDDAVYTVTVTLTDDGKGNLSTSMTIVKNQVEAEIALFTNNFTPDPITVDLDTAFGATKTIVDELGNVIQREDVVFSFVVTDLNGNEITTGTASGAEAVDGVMNIDFGTFTFSVEGEYRYLITERIATMDGYVLDTTVWCAHILVRYDPDTGKLSVSDSDVFTHRLAPEGHAEEGIQAQFDETPAFVNVYHADDVQLHLVMDKVMIGDRTAAKEHEFKFQLLAEDGTIVGEARNRADGTIHFYLDYTLQDLLDQPSRTFTYTVHEIIPEGGNVHNGITYDTAVYTLTVTLTDNGAGELVTTLNGSPVSGTVYTGIEFVNEYIAQDVTVSFHAIKRMEGMPLSDGLYTFYLMDGEDILATGTNLADGTIVFDKTLTFTEPGTYTYTMVEYKDTRPGVTFDETSFQVTVVVTDNGLGNLECEITYTTEEGIYDQPVFINIYKPTGINVVIEAHKELEGRELGEEFTFQLKDSEGNVVGEATNAPDGTVTFDSLHFDEVGTHTYTIEEVIPEGAVQNEDGTFTLNGVTYDSTVYTVVVEITDPGYDGQLDKTVTYYLGTETVEAAEVIFTNTYAADDSNGVVIEGTKVLENQDLREDAFEFQLKDSQGNVLQTKSHDADGLFAFDALVYTFADLEGQTEKVFTYTVSEILGSLGGVTYDKTVYTVTVTVTDDGMGKLTAVAVITGGKNDGTIVFTNVYATDATTVDVEAEKKLTGKDLEADEFEFVLVNQANADEKYTVSNLADGTVRFEDLTFSVAGTYVYDLYEQAGSDKHYTYDDQVITVTVTVTDNGDGTMTATVSYSEAPVFKNVYHPDPITVTLEGEKNLTGRNQTAGEFDFEARDADGRLVTTGTNKADGTIVFEDIVIDTEMELMLYVTEIKGTDKHMVYDDYTYRVKLSVVNEGGTLKATVTYLDGDILFYNEYKTPETPETGDDTPIHFYMSLMAFSALALMAVVVLGNKKRERKFC